MKLSCLFLAVSVLSGGYGQETDDLSPSTSSCEVDEQSCPSRVIQTDKVEKEVTYEACRRNPTWRGDAVDHDECRRLTGWNPRDFWWRVDKNHTDGYLEGKEKEMAECIDEHFQRAKNDGLWWAQCDENDIEDTKCHVPTTKVIGHYVRNDDEVDDNENGDLVIVKNTLTEQEAYGLESLQKCMHKFLPLEKPFYEERTFGDNGEVDGIYAGKGGNIVAYMTGLLYLYLPGVASSAYRAMTAAHQYTGWDVPAPNTMGMRNSEFLRYRRAGRLGLHYDSDSNMTISVALSDPDDFDGGYFHLWEEDALFKVPRLTAVVFLANTYHGITEIQGGQRKVFVTELWENDDVPLYGSPRPFPYAFEKHKEECMKIMQASGMKLTDEQAGRYEADIGIQSHRSGMRKHIDSLWK